MSTSAKGWTRYAVRVVVLSGAGPYFFRQCHIRLAAPHHTQQLARHFAEHPTVQTQGLDGVGSAESAGKKPFVVEIITGEREALYWGKVPEKVRRQAVEKAVLGDRGGDKTGDKRTDASIENGGSKRKRKRKT